MPQKVRDSNFELLRIVCMLIVVSAHVLPHAVSPIFANTLFSYATAGIFFADLYFVISGYFMVRNSSSTYKKIYTLLINIYLCALVSLIVFLILQFTGSYNGEPYNATRYLGLAVHHFSNPITSNEFWFVTAYVLLFILVPILNPLLNSLSKKGYVFFLFVMLVLYTMANSFNFRYVHMERAVLNYALGGFFALHVKPSNNKIRHNAILIPLTLLLIILTALENIHYAHYSSKNMFFHILEKTFLNGILFSLCTISIFSIFHNLNFKNNFVNTLSRTTFSIYLLHANAMTGSLWRLFLFELDIQSQYFIPKAIFNVIVIFTICAAFDHFVIERIERLLKPYTDSFYEKVRSAIQKKEKSEETV